MIRNILLGASALALTTAPVAVSAASVANPAQSLSLSPSVRAGTPTGRSNHLTGMTTGTIAAGVIGLGIVVGLVFLISDHEDNSDSN